MIRINVTNVQQYTIDRLRVSLNSSYETELLETLSFKLFKEDGTEVTERLKSISESNREEWAHLLMSQTMDICLKMNSQIEAGKYTFSLIRDGAEIHRATFITAHMEDIRVEFEEVRMVDIETIYVKLRSLTGMYQSMTAMNILKFSIIDEGGVQHNDAFQTLQDIVKATTEPEIREFYLKLLPGKTLPHGYYDVRFTSHYKSRTFPIVEKFTIPFNFMTTQPPKIVSVNIAKQIVTKQTVLSIMFNPFLEKSLLLSATREIIREKDGRDITAFFDATRISTTSYSSAGVDYTTRIEIPLVDKVYSLEKGDYTLRWTWPGTSVPTVEFKFSVGWVVTALDAVNITDGKYIDFDLPKSHFTEKFLEKYHLLVELNGEEINTDELFGPIEEVSAKKGYESPDRSEHFGVDILDMTKIQDGNYSFILWTEREADYNGFEGDIYYNYLGNLDIVQYLCPQIKEVYQSSVDMLTVVLEKPQPISIINQASLILYDNYGMIDFSNRLLDIENSNIWEPGQIMADRFNVVIKDDKTLASGNYQFKCRLRDKESNVVKAQISHVETRRGMITNIEQIALNKIKITFSEPQSRQFLLTTKFRVLKRYSPEGGEASSYESRFEYLENVLKADQSQFTELVIMMDNEDSLPGGRYEISFMYENDPHKVATVIYAYDVELGFMTNNIPAVKYANMMYDDDGNMLLEVNFINDLEEELYRTAMFDLIRSDGRDIDIDFKAREDWEVVTTVRRQNIRFVRMIRIPALDVEHAHIDRGIYKFRLSWEGIIPYMPTVEKDAILEYYLPKLKSAEVVAMDMNGTDRTARIYFEFPEPQLYTYMEKLQVEVTGPDGEDHLLKPIASDAPTSLLPVFKTVFESNAIDPSLDPDKKLSFSGFNLDIAKNADKMQVGKYLFVFYWIDEHNERISDWMIHLDVRQALRPQILEGFQSAINRITIVLREAIPRKLLEEMTIDFRNVNHTDQSYKFMTIDRANNDDEWAEDLREVSEFNLKLNSGERIGRGTYHFRLFNGKFLCDDCLFDIIWFEGATGKISGITPKSLDLVEMRFESDESRELFKTLSLHVETETGVDVSERFGSINDTYNMIDTDFFDAINMHITAPVPDGIYVFRFEKLYHESRWDSLEPNTIHLPFVSNEYPAIREVTVTKLGSVMDGDDALIIEFSPPLEKTLFDDCRFAIQKALNTDIDVTDKFKNIHENPANIEYVTDKYDIQYVQFLTVEFNNMTTLVRDRYKVKFDWNSEGIHGYMNSLEEEEEINYILFPLKSVDLIDSETVRLTFKEPPTAEYLSSSEVYVESRHTTVNADGPISTTVDFSYQFLKLRETNTFTPGELVPYVDVRMGTRDPDKPATDILPPNMYRFMIALDEDRLDEDGEPMDYRLRIVYAGSKYIEFMMNQERLRCNSVVTHHSYDKLKYTWAKLQFTQMLDEFIFYIRRTNPDTGDIVDYSSRFMNTRDANYYYHRLEDGKYDEGYYEAAEEYDIVINEIHYTLYQTLYAYAKLKYGSALPAHTYNVGFNYRGKEYFNNEITLPYMTSTPPNIRSMNIENNGDTSQLVIDFQPYAEYESLRASTMHIMTYKGDYADGTPKGIDKTSSFGLISSAETVELEKPDPEIRYVKSIKIPVNYDTILPSGWYRLKWTWPAYSFFPESIYVGGLKLLGLGVESARVVEKDKIEVKLQRAILAKEFKSLNLSVVGYEQGDISDSFVELSVSNADIKDEDKVATYYLKLDEGEEIGGDTYKFLLTQAVESSDEDDEDDYSGTGYSCLWEMTIVYMTTEWPDLERIDNLTGEMYEVIKLTKGLASSYVGREIQLLTSTNPDEIVTLEEEDVSDYIDKYVKVYAIPKIDHLTAEVDEEVIPSLISALRLEVNDDDGNSFSDSFQGIRAKNPTKYRDVLYSLKIRLPNFDTCGNIKMYDFAVTTASGRVITACFDDITKSNNFTSDSSRVKEFFIVVNEEYIIEQYELEGLVVGLEDASNKAVEKFTYTIQMQSISTSNKIQLYLAPETHFCPDSYTFKLTYTNDPDNEDCVWLQPFTYTGNMPFLSNNLGEIKNVIIVDREHIDLEFSVLTIPTNAFLSFELRVVDEDDNVLSSNTFENLMATNIFTDAPTLGDLDQPGIIHLQITEGVTIPAGMYRFQFWMDIAANESDGGTDDEEDDSADSPEPVKNVRTAEYCLWDRYTQLPIMFREMSNSITSVEVMDINRLKIILEKDMDISILKNFVVDLYDPMKDVTFKNKFDSVEKSNFFGLYVMPTDRRNILYSTTGERWLTFDTGLEYSYTKCFYHESSKTYFALTTKGKIIKFKEFDNVSWGKNPVTNVKYSDTPTSNSFNDYVIIDNSTMIIVGNSGTIMVGTINEETGDITLTNVNADKKITSNTLTAIVNHGTVTLAVGHRGTIIRSDDNGATWSTITTGILTNLNDICFHNNKLDVLGDLPEDCPEEEETDEEERALAIPGPVVEETVDTSAYFVCGNNGLIMMCADFADGFIELDNSNPRALFSISSHGNKIVAVGDAGAIITIDDTEDGFVARTTSNPNCKFSLREVTYAGNRFFVCSATSSWLTSKEGDKWTINTSFSDNVMKSVTYVPSQYSSDKANWFYLHVKAGEDISSVEYHTGWEAPTLECDLVKKWDETNTRDEHLNDFFTVFAFEDHRPKPKEFYHFVKKGTINVIEGDDPDLDENPDYELSDVTYSWEPCSGYTEGHSGLYYVRLRESEKDDVEDWAYSTPNAIKLPYMTSAKLEITEAIFHSPDDNTQVEYYKPYLELKFTGAVPNCFHYVTYSFINTSPELSDLDEGSSEDRALEGSGATYDTDHTDYFQSIRMAELTYDGGLRVSGMNIFGNTSKNLSDIKRGDYKLRWTWMAPGTAPDSEKYTTIHNITVKTMTALIDTFVLDPNNPSQLGIKFTKFIDSRYFLKANKFHINIRKVPKTRTEYDKFNNRDYSIMFDSVEDSTDFTAMEHEIQTDASGVQFVATKEIRMRLQDGKTLNTGNYLVKFGSDSNVYKSAKETDDQMWVACKDDIGLELLDELTTNLPELRSVSLENFTPSPVRDDGKPPRKFEHKGMTYASMYISNWTADGTIADHVADVYLDLSTDTTYYLVATPTGYEWSAPSEDLYLCAAFNGNKLPMYNTFMRRYASWSLCEMIDTVPGDDTAPQTIAKDGDISSWFKQDKDTFQFTYVFINDENGESHKYITKIYIPWEKREAFPGCDNGTFTLKFAPEGIYRNTEVRHIKMPKCRRSYGTIASVTSKNPSLRKADGTAGFIVKFQQDLPRDFVKDMKVDITRILTASEKKTLGVKENEIIMTERFKTLAECNSSVNDSKITTINKINLWLRSGEILDHGKYKIKLTGEETDSNVVPLPEGVSASVVMTKTVTCPWLTTRVPNNISAKLTTSSDGKNPILTITFLGHPPAKSSIIKSTTNNRVNGSFKVLRHSSKGNYTEVFRALTNKTVKFKTEPDRTEETKGDTTEKWIKSISIPMKDNTCILKGTYDVTFKFSPSSLLEEIPWVKSGSSIKKYAQFTVANVILTRIGYVSDLSTLDSRRMKVSIKKNAPIKTNRLLAKSQIGRAMKVKTWKALLAKFSFKMTVGSGKLEYNKRFGVGKKNVKFSDNYVTLRIKPNYILNPLIYRCKFVYKGSTPISPRYHDMAGLIWNKIGKAASDPRVWIIEETEPAGKENVRVYKTYKSMKGRRNRIKRINALNKYKHKLCAQCRKIKLLSTNKITGCINSYDIPYHYKEGIAKFFAKLVKSWYKMRSKKVKIKLAKGKKFDKRGNIVKDKKNPKKVHAYTCANAPFKGFKFEKRVEGKGEERQVSFGCANYTKKMKNWKYSCMVATVKKGQVPKKKRSKMYFGQLNYQPRNSPDGKVFHLKRGFKSTKKGKKTVAFKRYVKMLMKMVATKKRLAKRCTRCRKKELAEKKNKKIGWGAARFPVQVMIMKTTKKLPSLLNVSEKKGGYKSKKKKNKNGCKKPRFVWTKVTYKKKPYAKLKCKNAKTFPKKLTVSTYQGMFYKC